MEDLSIPFLDSKIESTACNDALGFMLGTAVARRLNVGIIPLRKDGKLPMQAEGVDFRDYLGEIKRLEIRKNISLPQARVLLVDEWIETGVQIKAAANLLERQGAIIEGISTINMDLNKRTEEIARKYRVHVVWEAKRNRI
jgi:adenine phosphoribosyltransferase